jgi:hypothetical protein
MEMARKFSTVGLLIILLLASLAACGSPSSAATEPTGAQNLTQAKTPTPAPKTTVAQVKKDGNMELSLPPEAKGWLDIKPEADASTGNAVFFVFTNLSSDKVLTIMPNKWNSFKVVICSLDEKGNAIKGSEHNIIAGDIRPRDRYMETIGIIRLTDGRMRPRVTVTYKGSPDAKGTFVNDSNSFPFMSQVEVTHSFVFERAFQFTVVGKIKNSSGQTLPKGMALKIECFDANGNNVSFSALYSVFSISPPLKPGEERDFKFMISDKTVTYKLSWTKDSK